MPAPLLSPGCWAVVSPFEICASRPPFSTRFPPSRNCIGEKFALLEAKTILAMLYCAFEFEYASSTPEQVGGVGLAVGLLRAGGHVGRGTCNRTPPPAACLPRAGGIMQQRLNSSPLACLLLQVMMSVTAHPRYGVPLRVRRRALVAQPAMAGV